MTAIWPRCFNRVAWASEVVRIRPTCTRIVTGAPVCRARSPRARRRLADRRRSDSPPALPPADQRLGRQPDGHQVCFTDPAGPGRPRGRRRPPRTSARHPRCAGGSVLPADTSSKSTPASSNLCPAREGSMAADGASLVFNAGSAPPCSASLSHSQPCPATGWLRGSQPTRPGRARAPRADRRLLPAARPQFRPQGMAGFRGRGCAGFASRQESGPASRALLRSRHERRSPACWDARLKTS